jgi:hypothetical protein
MWIPLIVRELPAWPKRSRRSLSLAAEACRFKSFRLHPFLSRQNPRAPSTSSFCEKRRLRALQEPLSARGVAVALRLIGDNAPGARLGHDALADLEALLRHVGWVSVPRELLA